MQAGKNATLRLMGTPSMLLLKLLNNHTHLYNLHTAIYDNTYVHALP